MNEKKINELTHMEAIRLLSGIFHPEQAIHILAFVSLIARNHAGDASDDFTDKQLMKVRIKLKRD